MEKREISDVFLARVNRDRVAQGLQPVTPSAEVRVVPHPAPNGYSA